jgi:hypothetical protein
MPQMRFTTGEPFDQGFRLCPLLLFMVPLRFDP